MASPPADSTSSTVCWTDSRLMSQTATLAPSLANLSAVARPIPWPEASYHLIDADTLVCEGLTVIPTPGHTAGHLSALVSLPNGRHVILAADAINRASEPAEGFADADNPAAAQASANYLLSLAPPEAILIYGHEPTQWPVLPKAPKPW